MPTRIYLRLAEILAAAALAAIVIGAWRAERRDSAQLTADLAAAKQSLAQADARQHQRDAQLLQTLATFAAEKRNITTPAQIVRDLPQQIPLPSPITLQSDPCAPGHASGESFASTPSKKKQSTLTPPAAPCSSGPLLGPEGLDSTRSTSSKLGAKPVETNAVVPAEDLKPLYDFAIDCKACQAKLAAAQADLTDERAKAVVLTHERDEAVHVAKGGNLLRRIARNAKWLAIGALAGAVAAKAHP